MSTATSSPEAEILARLIRPEDPDFTPEGARSILAIQFDEADTQRMNELAAKARDGALSGAEEAQLHGYLFVGAMIDLMHSKARISLQHDAD